MSGGERVLLLELRERTSAAGNRYLSGWLGKASVVAFLDRDAAEPTWQVYVSTPTPKGERQGSAAQPRGATAIDHPLSRRTTRKPRQRGSTRLPPGELDDDVSDL